MPAFGYTTEFEKRLLSLREVSFELSTEDLRRVATYFVTVADLIDSGTLRTGHVHIDMFDAPWAKDHPDLDVIVFNPRAEPARTLKLDE